MRARREKNLCYNCDEVFVPGHRCKLRQVYMIMSQEEEEAYTVDAVDPDPPTKELLSEDMTISINAISGNSDLNTLRIKGLVKHSSIQILIDSRSTHCFLDETVATNLGCHVEFTNLMLISVADGNKMVSRTVCPDFTWEIQGTKFTYPMRIIKLGGCDVVLGGDWLRNHSPVEFDYQKMKLTICKNGKKLIMKAITESAELQLLSECNATTLVIPTWIQEVQNSYSTDSTLQIVVQDKLLNPSSHPDYSFASGILRLQGKICIGNDPNLKIKIIQALHNSSVGGYSDKHFPVTTLPHLDDNGNFRVFPAAILARRLIPRNHHPIPQVLIQWNHSSPEQATWEDYSYMSATFPCFDPCGQGSQKQGSNAMFISGRLTINHNPSTQTKESRQIKGSINKLGEINYPNDNVQRKEGDYQELTRVYEGDVVLTEEVKISDGHDKTEMDGADGRALQQALLMKESGENNQKFSTFKGANIEATRGEKKDIQYFAANFIRF
ncbi:hypothetical protein BUALT_Bualt12G0106000 [Buddleja alternifolia]|uniref:Uncharacterized protein n=1 Tax=Buddleja alternifolia TaxID=168488 RepID=A0AAV6WYP3_9LAMI|nr:hypothetical protein BUALT_Bualt12G0106000 [Buddleja alternifolia]